MSDSGNPLNVTGAIFTGSTDSLSADERPHESQGIAERLVEADEFVPMDMFTAASIGDLDSVKELITRGSDVNAASGGGGWTALHYAAYIGHSRVLRFLLDSGAKVEARNAKGRTALMLAASCGNDATLRELLRQHARLEAKDNHGWSALFYATTANHVNAGGVLVAAGADVNDVCCTAHGISPFHIAAAEGHELLLLSFLQYGADVGQKCAAGTTARDLARLSGRDKIMELLDTHRKGGTGIPPRIDIPAQPVKEFIPARPKATVNPQKPAKALPKAPAAPKADSLSGLLTELGIAKYLPILEEQGVDLTTFLQLTDADLKEAGIRLIGPRKKMTNAIARWHSAEANGDAAAAYHKAQAEAALDKARMALERVSRSEEALEEAVGRAAGLEEQLRSLGALLGEAASLLKARKHEPHASKLLSKIAEAGFTLSL